jgi:glutaconate CoA-transferase subunit B
MRPQVVTKELAVMSLHPGVTREQVQANTGWAIRFADDVAETPPPSERELAVLRDLQQRTARAHAG